MIEGNSILYALLKLRGVRAWLPGDGVDVHLHPMALAAWVGLLVTMINLMPIGQLDGGHVARAALGDRHERLSARLHVALPLVGLADRRGHVRDRASTSARTSSTRWRTRRTA